MTQLVVPQRHRETLVALAQATAAQVEALIAVLSTDVASQYVPRERLIEMASGAFSKGSSGALDPALVVDVLLTMSSARTRVHPQTADGFASDVAEATNLELTTKKRKALQTRLARLLGIEAVARSAKVVDLADEHERIFHSARVMTDIRPVFGEDPTQLPEGAITFHVLKLEFFVAGRVEDVFISLDDGDLSDLKFAVDRAIDKASTLARYLDGVGLSRYDTKEDTSA